MIDALLQATCNLVVEREIVRQLGPQPPGVPVRFQIDTAQHFTCMGTGVLVTPRQAIVTVKVCPCLKVTRV